MQIIFGVIKSNPSTVSGGSSWYFFTANHIHFQKDQKHRWSGELLKRK